MNTPLFAVSRIVCVFVLLCAGSLAGGGEPTLEMITSEPDWIARSPSNPRWLVDGSGIRYSARREGVLGRDFSDRYVVPMDDLDAGAVMVEPGDPVRLVGNGDWDTRGREQLFVHAGDLFVYSVTAGSSRQLTRTSARESKPMFLSDGSGYAFVRDGVWVVRLFNQGMEYQAADIRFADEPGEDEEEAELDYLHEQQRRLFVDIRNDDAREDLRELEDERWRDADPTRVVGAFYLGEDKRSRGRWLSPSGRHMLVAVVSKDSTRDPRDQMADYVNEDGYVSTRTVRPKVGQETETAVEVVLLDLVNETVIELSFDGLATITDDPLAWLKDAQEEGAEEDEEPDDEVEDELGARPVSLLGVRWNDAGDLGALMLRSHDNKDRWIAVVDTDADEPGVDQVHHLRDEAWIGWDFNEFGWVPGESMLWYLSEESGYAHLYTWENGRTEQRTAGSFEVRDVWFVRDGESAYVRTNRAHPGMQELETIVLSTGVLTAITRMGGTVGSYRVSPDEMNVVLSWSNINSPSELYVVDLAAAVPTPRRITNTVSDEFLSVGFVTPEIVAIPSSHTDQPIYTRVYAPEPGRFDGPRPIVVFSHGSGYTQHANYEWSYYKREHMYHTMLVNEGFIVISPDFRASAGYGRDWRTAIYRQMGYKELEDFQDCIDWAVENLDGDRERVGIYGGSYGGFMTLMAMFLEPETYKCGAALRSVTDWAHYNHGYTSNILNTPELDPEAFAKSSPIEHAEGLEGHLLMLHGMMDDNVVAQDIIRLSQRLIELEKENWELALNPIEAHGYQEPSSWLDQMRRIHKLFMTNLADDQD